MKRLAAVLSAMLSMLFFLAPAAVAADPESDLVRYLDRQFSGGCRAVSEVGEMYGERLTFATGDEDISRGRELVAASRVQGVPACLCPRIAVIRVEDVQAGVATARRTAAFGKQIESGDHVLVPASPMVFLYANARHKDAFSPYGDLLKTLLESGREVVELSSPEVAPPADRYGILCRLEVAGDHIATKVQSIYFGDTWFSESRALSGTAVAETPPGIAVSLLKAGKTEQSDANGDRHLASSAGKSAREVSEAKPVSEDRSSKSFEKAGDVEPTEFFRLDRPFRRFVAGDIDGDSMAEFVFLEDKGVKACRLGPGELGGLADFSFVGKEYVGLYLEAMDLDGDGRDEAIATLGIKTAGLDGSDVEIASMVMSFADGRFKVLEEGLPYYFRVVEDREGNRRLVGQKKGARDLFEGPVLHFSWNRDKGAFATPTVYDPAREVYSAFQFAQVPSDPARVAILEPTGLVQVYRTKNQAVEAVSDQNYGVYRETSLEIPAKREKYLGGFQKQSHDTVYAPPRFMLKREYDDQFFLIRKERKPASGIGAVRNALVAAQGEDSVAAIKWDGRNIRQTWQSRGIAKNILDFGFYPREGEDSLYVLVRDNGGYALQAF